MNPSQLAIFASKTLLQRLNSQAADDALAVDERVLRAKIIGVKNKKNLTIDFKGG